MHKMIEELATVLDHLTVKARESQAAAEDAHIVAEEAQQLLRAVAILNRGQKSNILDHEVELTCDEPDLTWIDQSIDIDAEIEVGDRDATVMVTLNQHTVDLGQHQLDALEVEYAVVSFSVHHLVEGIAEVIRDHSSGEQQNEAAIAAIANELRRLV